MAMINREDYWKPEKCPKCGSMDTKFDVGNIDLTENTWYCSSCNHIFEVKTEFDIEIIRKEIQRIKEYIDEHMKCPYCGKKMEYGGGSWYEDRYGCYKNKECSYKKNYRHTFSIDFGFESRRIYELKGIERAYLQGIKKGKE